ncbi:MAG: transposase [Solirubrobacteraceae bacterium]
MTSQSVDATVALSIVTAAGDFHRFPRPGQLASCLGLNPRVRQSGRQLARGAMDEQFLASLSDLRSTVHEQAG